MDEGDIDDGTASEVQNLGRINLERCWGRDGVKEGKEVVRTIPLTPHYHRSD